MTEFNEIRDLRNVQLIRRIPFRRKPIGGSLFGLRHFCQNIKMLFACDL
jgi:hypothetical protein